MRVFLLFWIGLLCLFTFSGCAIHHSKQAILSGTAHTPGAKATFVTEEDSGLQLGGLISITEPDHYAVLLERARRRYHCSKMHHAQLDFYTDHWLIIAFPISRVTLICEQGPAKAQHTLADLPKVGAPRGASIGAQ